MMSTVMISTSSVMYGPRGQRQVLEVTALGRAISQFGHRQEKRLVIFGRKTTSGSARSGEELDPDVLSLHLRTADDDLSRPTRFAGDDLCHRRALEIRPHQFRPRKAIPTPPNFATCAPRFP